MWLRWIKLKENGGEKTGGLDSTQQIGVRDTTTHNQEVNGFQFGHFLLTDHGTQACQEQ